MKNIYIILVCVLFIALPFAADACPLCQGGAGNSKAMIASYNITTGLLFTLPMIMGGGIFLWIRKKKKDFEQRITHPNLLQNPENN